MFSTLFDKVQTLLSRTFWLGNFFPVLVFTLLNLGIAWVGLGEFASWLARQWPDPTALSPVPVFALIAIGIVAFMLGPLTPVFRAALEGEFLPKKARRMLRREFTAKAARAESRIRRAEANFVFFDQINRSAQQTFENARGAAGARNNHDLATFNAARAAVEVVKRDMAAQGPARAHRRLLPAQTPVRNAIAALDVALRQYPMDPNHRVPGITDPLDDMQRELRDLLQSAKDIANRIWQSAEADLRTSFVPLDIRPTSIGNSRAALEQYPVVAYHADFDFLWPRLRMVIAQDATISAAVDTASAQLDFAVLMTVLAAATAVFWLIALPWLGSSVLLYFLVGILIPALVPFFYSLVAETQRAFGGVMEMAVDGLHFSLLSALRLPLPNTLEAEQRTWRELQIALYSGLGTGVRFRQPTS